MSDDDCIRSMQMEIDGLHGQIKRLEAALAASSALMGQEEYGDWVPDFMEARRLIEACNQES